MSDVLLVYMIVGILLLSAVLRLLLAKKQGKPLGGFFLWQGFLFPAALLVSLILLQTGKADIVVPVVFLGILEELICAVLRRRQ